MRSEKFITTVARGMAVAGVAGWLAPQNRTDPPEVPIAVHEAASGERATTLADGTNEAREGCATLTINQTPTEWTKKFEREFRKLAALEAKGTLSQVDAQTLEELTRWRNRLLHGQTADEVEFQLRRDHLLERMENVIKEYVKFRAAGQERPASK